MDDRDAFGKLVLKYQDTVFGTAWRILGNREDAEDAAQDTFLRAWRSLSRFDPDRPFRPWILRIAVNTALKIRSRRRDHARINELRSIERIPDIPARSPAQETGCREVQEMLERMVDQLPPESATLFQLRYGEELSLDEIARILGRRPGTLAVALHRIRERFRRILFGSDEEVKS